MAEFTWSYSSLKEYTNCPKQYQEMRVLQNYTKEPTKQMLYGTEVHKALEEYVQNNVQLPKNYERFKSMVDALIDIGGTRYPEHKMALDTNRQPCEFDYEKRWVRGIADLLIIDSDMAYIVDYKTGSNKYPDPKQLRLMSLMTFAHFPEVKHIKAGLLFVMHDSFITEEYTRDGIEASWEVFTPDLARLGNSFDTNTWQPNPTPLCRYCPVEPCKFHRR